MITLNVLRLAVPLQEALATFHSGPVVRARSRCQITCRLHTDELIRRNSALSDSSIGHGHFITIYNCSV